MGESAIVDDMGMGRPTDKKQACKVQLLSYKTPQRFGGLNSLHARTLSPHQQCMYNCY
jgi:hypothetical protein